MPKAEPNPPPILRAEDVVREKPPPDEIEQAAKRRLNYELTLKAVTWFMLLGQVRQQATDEADALLTESIRQHGVLQPVGARPDGTLVWGHRRLRCAIAAGLKEILAVILPQDMTEGEFLTLQMLENVQRADLHQYDLWQGCVRLLEANEGWQLKDVAKAISLTPSSVTHILSPSKCIPEVQEALKVGKLTLAHVYTISKLPLDKQPGLLALKLSGASRDQLEEAGRKARTEASQEGKPPPDKCERVRIPLAVATKEVKASGTVTVASSPGAAISFQETENLLKEALKAVREAQGRGLGLKAAQAAWRDMAAPKPKAV